MLQKYIETLCEELDIKEIPKLEEKSFYLFPLNDQIKVTLKDLAPGVSFFAKIKEASQKRKEELYLLVMRANLLGQGTGGSRLGLDADEKTLTLSLGLPYELNYKVFKENFEDFVNYLNYWREEISKFEKEEKIL